MDVTFTIYFILLFLHITHYDCEVVDFSAEALQILKVWGIDPGTSNEKRLAGMIVLKQHERDNFFIKAANLETRLKQLEMQLCLRPSLEKATRLVVPFWLSGMKPISLGDMWVISIVLELTPEAKLFGEVLQSHKITLKEFSEAIERLYKKLSEEIGLCHGKGLIPPNEFGEEDWKILYDKVGVNSYKAQQSLKAIVTVLDRFDKDEHHEYTTTTTQPQVGRNFVLLLGRLPFKDTDTVADRRNHLLEWFGIKSDEKLSKIYFPIAGETNKFSAAAFIKIDNLEDDKYFIDMVTNLHKNVNRDIDCFFYGNKDFCPPSHLVDVGEFVTKHKSDEQNPASSTAQIQINC